MTIPDKVIEQLKQLDCEDVAAKLGIVVSRHKARCFMHDDRIPSLSFYSGGRTKWHCFSCAKGGDAIGLVMNAASLDFMEACHWLCSVYGINIPQGLPRPRRKTLHIPRINEAPRTDSGNGFDRETAAWILDSFTLDIDACLFLFEKRLLDKKVVNSLKIVSISDGPSFSKAIISRFGEERAKKSGLLNDRLNPRFWTPCIVFPYFDTDNNLIGLQTRYMGNNREAPRFQFLSNQKSHIFNLPILKNLPDGATLYITEGVTDCLAMLSDGKNAIAIPSATIIPQEDLWLLRRYRLRMSPDNDEAGKKGFRKLREALAEEGETIYCEPIPEGFKDYSEYYANKKKDSGKDA